MRAEDITKAQSLSKQLASLGYTPKRLPKKEKPARQPFYTKELNNLGFTRSKKKVPPTAFKSSFKFDYNALKGRGVEPLQDLRPIVEPLVKQYLASLEAPTLELTPEIVKEIIKLMHSLPEVDKLEVSKGLRNASSFLFGGTKYGMHEMMHGGASSTTAGINVYGEVVAGSGTSWTLATTPSTGTLRLFANGQRLTKTVDYSLAGTAITTLTSWVAGTVLADYLYV